MAANPLSISVATNEALNRTLTLTTKNGVGATIPLDLTGATFKAEVRKAAGAPGAPIATIDVTILDAPNGQIKFYVAQSALGSVKPGSYIYDLVYTPAGGDPDRLWQAGFNVVAGVTL